VIDLLHGVRVLESASLLNGDNVGMLLADLGADVLKIESPKRGDYLRDILGQITPHHSPAHIQVNRNKRSVTLDLRTDRGRELFWRLHATADVFIDGNVAGACDDLGIGYEAQRARKPDIIYCQHTGFGGSGPYAKIPTHGMSMSALAADVPTGMGADGFMHLLPRSGRFDRPGGNAPFSGAIFAAYYVAAALVRRDRSGRGQRIDVSAAESVIAQTWFRHVYTLNEHRLTDERTIPPLESGELQGATYQFYETSDGKSVLFCCVEPKFWIGFCVAVGRPDLVDRTDQSMAVDFGENADDLRRELQEIFSSRTQREWLELAASHGVALAPAPRNSFELRDDPQLAARQILREGSHPDAGDFTYVGIPAMIDGQEFEIRRPAPRLGEHTREVLGALGLSDDEMAQLAVEGVT